MTFTYAIAEIEADTPEQALQKARHLWDTNIGWFDWQTRERDESQPEEIEIEGTDGEGAWWQNPDLRRRLAAADMLEALELAVGALNYARRFRVPHLDMDSYQIASKCDAAIKKARG
jgi:hypothetical protein